MSKLVNIQEALRNYKPGQRQSLADTFFDKNDRTITWQINNLCNFNCPYCSHYTKDDPDVYKYSPEHIENCFNKTGKTWHIIITGGEPFLHKDLIEICERLTRNHYISLNTNLSSKKVIEFADKIDPKRVLTVNASIHYSVRMERNIMEDYINSFLYMQDKGFLIIGSYVVFPDVLDQYQSHLEYLKSRGLKLLSSKVYHGNFNGKSYPSAFSESEIDGLTSYMSNEIEMKEYLLYTNFEGLKCSTGRKMLSMKPNGDLERCLSEYTSYGNLFSGKYKLPLFDKKCKTAVCNCPYQGMLFTYKKKSIF